MRMNQSKIARLVWMLLILVPFSAMASPRSTSTVRRQQTLRSNALQRMTTSAAASGSSSTGRLEGIRRSLNEDDDDDGGDNRDSSNPFTVVYDWRDRLVGDALDMWDTEPSSWIQEYWEVFVAMAVIVSLVLCCHLYMCIDICCCGGGGSNGGMDGGRVVATPDEIQDRRKQMGKPILGAPQDEDDFKDEELTNDWVAPPKKARNDGHLQDEFVDEPEGDGLKSKRSLGSPTDQETPGDDSKRSRFLRKKLKLRKRAQPAEGAEKDDSLVSEIVSAWSEFLTEVFTGRVKHEDAGEARYEKYEEREPKRRSREDIPKRRAGYEKYHEPSSPRSPSHGKGDKDLIRDLA